MENWWSVAGTRKGIWAKAKAGDLAAIDRAVRIIEKRAWLLGLNAPIKLDVNNERERALMEKFIHDADAMSQLKTLAEKARDP